MAIISTIKGKRSSIPRRDGEIGGHLPSANAMDESTAKKEGVTSEQSDSESSWFILNECAEVLDPTRKL